MVKEENDEKEFWKKQISEREGTEKAAKGSQLFHEKGQNKIVRVND